MHETKFYNLTHRNIRGNKNRAPPRLKRPQRILTLTLTLISMNAACWETTFAQNIFNVIAIAFSFDKNEDETFLNREEETHEMIEFVVLFDVFYGLSDILGCRS